MKKLENNYYRSGSTLPIYNFYELLNTSDLRWLLKDFEEGDDITLSEIQEAQFKEVWENIYEKYTEDLSEGKGGKDYMILAEISTLETELYIVGTLMSVYLKSPSEAVKKQIEKWRYYPDDSEKTLKKMDSVKFRISIIKSKNKELFTKQEETQEKIEYDLYKDVVLLEQSFGEGKTIDVRKTVLSKWVVYCKTAQEKVKKLKKKTKNGR